MAVCLLCQAFLVSLLPEQLRWCSISLFVTSPFSWLSVPKTIKHQPRSRSARTSGEAPHRWDFQKRRWTLPLRFLVHSCMTRSRNQYLIILQRQGDNSVFVTPGDQICCRDQAALRQEPCQAGMLQKQAAPAPDQHLPRGRCLRSWKWDRLILVVKGAQQASSAATFCQEEVQETAGPSPADLSQALVLAVADFKNKSF